MRDASELSVTKIASDLIIVKGQLIDLTFGLKELSGKLDTLIALKQVELGRQQQPQEQQSQRES